MFDNREMLQSATAAAAALPEHLLERVRSTGVSAGFPSGATAGLPTDDALLPVPQALAELFPGGGLRRGSTVTVSGSSSLVLALLAEVSGLSGRLGWCAEVGSPLLGSAAAAEMGVVLERFVRVAQPGEQWPSVVASLLEAFDIVVVHPPARVREADMRRLTARARERSAVLLVTGPGKVNGNVSGAHPTGWPGAMVSLSVITQRWHGLGAGHGYLRSREVEVQAEGRGAAARPRQVRLWLPGPNGLIAPAHSSAA
jgi:hypothetical protein